MRIFLEHPIFAVAKELDGLFAFADEIVNEDFEIFVLVEKMNSVLVLGDNETQVLIRVRQDIQNVRRRIFQILGE